MLLASTVAAVSLAVALPLGVLIFRTDLPGRRFWRLLLVAGILLPLHVQAAAWLAAFGIQGWVTTQFWPATIWGKWLWVIGLHTAAAIPWMLLFCGLGLSLAEPELEEMALLDGGVWWTLTRVTVPRARDAIAAGTLWVGVCVAGEMTITDLFGARTLAEEIYTQHAVGGSDLGHSYLLQVLAPTIALLLASTLAMRAYRPRATAVARRSRLILPLGRSRWFALGFAATIATVVSGVPLMGLIGRAGIQRMRVDDQWHTRWSGEKLLRLVCGAPIDFQREFVWSLLIACVAASIALSLAIVLAWVAREGGRRAAAAWLVVATCAAIPGPLLGKTTIAILNHDVWLLLRWPLGHWLYDRTIFAMVAVQAARALPIAMLSLWSAFRTIPRELLELAALDGHRPAATLVRIVLPWRRRAVALGWCLAWATAFGELPASLLVAPPGVTTLPIRIFELIHFGVDDRVATICLVLVAGAIAGGLLLTWRANRVAQDAAITPPNE